MCVSAKIMIASTSITSSTCRIKSTASRWMISKKRMMTLTWTEEIMTAIKSHTVGIIDIGETSCMAKFRILYSFAGTCRIILYHQYTVVSQNVSKGRRQEELLFNKCWCNNTFIIPKRPPVGKTSISCLLRYLHPSRKTCSRRFHFDDNDEALTRRVYSKSSKLELLKYGHFFGRIFCRSVL